MHNLEVVRSNRTPATKFFSEPLKIERRIKVEIPKNLIKLAEKVREKREKERVSEIASRLADMRRERKKTAERLKAGIKHARKIFDWAREFTKSPESRMLIQIGVKYGHREGIYFFTEKAPGRNSRALGVSEKGLWWVQFGCMAREHYVQTPEDLASEVEPEILKLACETLKDGRVWKCIEEHMQLRLSE